MTLGSALVVLAWIGAQPAAGQATPAPAEPIMDDAAEGSDSAKPSDLGDDSAPADVPSIDPDLKSVEERLLGDAPVVPPTPTDRSSEPLLLPDTPSWMWPVGLLMLAGIVALKWKTQRAPDPAARLRVIQRVMLGREGHLALVEVGEDDDRRRLLIGYGAGAPRLVAELDVSEVATASPRPESTSAAPAAQRWQRALNRLGITTPEAPKPNAGRQGAAAGKRDASAADTPSSRSEARLRPRRSLVEQVLAEREPSTGGGEEPTEILRVPAPSSSPRPVVKEEEPSDDQADRETYTFRGLIG